LKRWIDIDRRWNKKIIIIIITTTTTIIISVSIIIICHVVDVVCQDRARPRL